MNDYFKLPTGYACISRTGTDGLYAYTSNYQTRDQYEFDNFKYVKIGTSTNNMGYNVNSCLPSTISHLIPSSVAGYLFLSATIFVSVIVIGVFHVFKR